MKKRKKIIVLLLLMLFLCTSAYLVFIGYRGLGLYNYVKGNYTIMSFGVFESDPTLGWAPRAGSRGQMMYLYPPHIPHFYNQDRFRVSKEESTPIAPRPHVLSLGDSFAHGDACLSEEVYSSLVAKAKEGTAFNAGFCAYGLSQVLLLAEKIIPKYEPDFVLVQYSPWLVSRALSYFAPTCFGVRPQPYFYIDDEDQLKIHPPVFSPRIFKHPAVKYRGYQRSIPDFFSFLAKIAIPVMVCDDLKMLSFYAKKSLKLLPEAAGDRLRVIRHAYGKISRFCEDHQSELVICIIGTFGEKPRRDEVQLLKQIPRATVVNTWPALRKRLPQKTAKVYFESYGHFRGEPPVFVDPHPNQRAHKMIAQEILAHLNDHHKQ